MFEPFTKAIILITQSILVGAGTTTRSGRIITCQEIRMDKLGCVLFVLVFIAACSRAQETQPSPASDANVTTSKPPVVISPKPETPAMPPTNSPSPSPTETVSFITADALSALQPLTIENANKIELLRTMIIPDYNRGQISQCTPSFSPDGRLLVGACGKNQVPVWDVQTGLLVHTLYDEPVHIVTCAFSPDGKQSACGGFDKTVTLWDVLTGTRTDSFEEHAAPVWDIAFSPDGKSLVSCSLGLIGGGAGKGDVSLWNVLDMQPLWVYSGTQDKLSLSFHPSGKTIAYGSIGGSVGILDSETGDLLLELTDSSRNIGSVAYSPSGRWLAAGSDDNFVYLWDTSSYTLSVQLREHKGYVNGVAFSPDETLLVSGSHDRTVDIWNLADQKLITLLKGHEREVLRVAFSPDGTLVASISWDGTVRLWGVPR